VIFEASTQLLFSETLTEADVRATVIDPLFVTSLGWPEEQIRREKHTVSGDYVDYEFGRPNTLLIVEAKRATKPFRVPQQTHRRTFSINALVAGDPQLKEAIEQAAGYCQDEGVAHAAVTNGIQLVVFKAVRTDRPWRKGEALVFRSIDDILVGFAELWDLLAYPSVRAGTLDAFFAFPDETPRHTKSVISTLANPDEKLLRNALNSELIPILRAAFEDLTEDDQAQALQYCYVYSSHLHATADNFILTIRDLPPAYLRGQVEHLDVQRAGAVPVQRAIENMAESRRRGAVLLLLGGVGAGKTTFLRQVRVKYCAKTIEESGAFYYVDFRDAPRNPPFEDFVFSTIRKQLNNDPLVRRLFLDQQLPVTVGTKLLNEPALLAHVFREELAQVDAMARTLGATNADVVAQEKLRKLSELSGRDREVVARVFGLIEAADRFILLALDNADQHPLSYQLDIFMFAQNVAAETGANIVCALREEKYYLASQQGAFNAFHTQRFHIPSPRLKDLLAQRLDYAQKHLEQLLDNTDEAKVADVRAFLDTIWRGCVGLQGSSGSSNVVRLLERICMGDMRRALRMFRRFMQSGNTDVRKILSIYRENSHARIPYHVPFHEFTKSVMLDDRRYYREGDTEDEVVNLFATSGQPPNSHFTSLRILAFLMESSERRTQFGSGFVEWGSIVSMFEAIFPDTRDVRFHLDKMIFRSLIESDTGITAIPGESPLEYCRAVRATPSGEYYLTFLVRAFAYLDLVWVDTPLADTATLTALREFVPARDKAGRFERVDTFLAYLRSEEDREFRDFPALGRASPWSGPFVPAIAKQIEREKVVIARRFARYERPSIPPRV
jgi:hypothetical protein